MNLRMLRRLRNLKRKAVGNGAEKQANQPRISLEESPIMRVAIEQVGRGLPANLAQKFAAAAVEEAGAGNVSKSALAILRHILTALWSLRRVHPRAGAAVGGHAGPVQHADQGQRLRGRVCLTWRSVHSIFLRRGQKKVVNDHIFARTKT